jgi:glycosyltransferase involved in cell wall biosynthesis
MRILIVSDEGFSAGGIGTSTANLAVALARAGQDVVLVWPDANSNSVQLEGVRQIPVRAKRFNVGKLGFLMLALPPARGAMPIDWQPEVVHIMRPTYLSIWAYRLARAAKAKVVLAMHEIVEQLPDTTLIGRGLRGLARWWFRTTYNLADVSVTPAKFVTHHAHKTLGLKKKPDYLSNALGLIAWQKTVQDVEVINSESPSLSVRLCSVINFSPYKNPLMMPELIAHLRKKGVDVHLHLAGGGVLYADVQKRITELGVGDAVHLLGPLDRINVARLIASSDAFLLTSHFELQPMVLIEAKALGTPALVANAPLSGAVDLISNGVTGVLFDLDLECAVAQLEPFLRDPVRLRAMRQATREDADQYDLARVAQAALDIYRS